jgi:hypothetical protein
MPRAATELVAAIAGWQERHQVAAVLSTGFLDGSHPIVDAYELGTRLQHMLRRLGALSEGALVQVCVCVCVCVRVCVCVHLAGHVSSAPCLLEGAKCST